MSVTPRRAILALVCASALPLLIAAFAPAGSVTYWVGGGALAGLMVLGGIAAHTGGAPIPAGVMRVTFWGALAMVVTAAAGRLFGAAG